MPTRAPGSRSPDQAVCSPARLNFTAGSGVEISQVSSGAATSLQPHMRRGHRRKVNPATIRKPAFVTTGGGMQQHVHDLAITKSSLAILASSSARSFQNGTVKVSAPACQSAYNFDPISASKNDAHFAQCQLARCGVASIWRSRIGPAVCGVFAGFEALRLSYETTIRPGRTGGSQAHQGSRSRGGRANLLSVLAGQLVKIGILNDPARNRIFRNSHRQYAGSETFETVHHLVRAATEPVPMTGSPCGSW